MIIGHIIKSNHKLLVSFTWSFWFKIVLNSIFICLWYTEDRNCEEADYSHDRNY